MTLLEPAVARRIPVGSLNKLNGTNQPPRLAPAYHS